MGKGGAKACFRVMLKHFEIKEKVFRYYIKQLDSMLPCVCNRSQKTSKCFKNISDPLGYASCATFLFLPHFDVMCDLFKGTGQNNYTRTGPTFGVEGEVLKDSTYLRTLPTTFYWLLNLSWHRNIQLARVGFKWQTRKVRFESNCNFLLVDRALAMQ